MISDFPCASTMVWCDWDLMLEPNNHTTPATFRDRDFWGANTGGRFLRSQYHPILIRFQNAARQLGE